MLSNSRKIKIIYVTAALETGGAEMFLLDLVTHLDRQKFDPAIVAMIGGGALEPRFRAAGAPLYIYGRHFRWRYFSAPLQIIQLWRLFRREKPQIVHTQLFGPDVFGRLAAWLAGVPVIVTTEQNINRDQSWLRELLKKWTYYLTDQVVAISAAVKKYTVARYGVPPEKIEIIPNDVDVKNFQSEILNLKSEIKKPAGKKVILTIGRLVPQKGHRYLLEAFAKLKDRENYELWIAGEGPLRSCLEKQTKDLGIDDQVRFLGERSDVPALLAQADLFVFPSLWEGLGIALLEAALAKAPIVATAVDGVLDILQDNITGRLVEAADSQVLAIAMEEALANSEQTKEMAERAYQFVKENFDVKVVVKKYEGLYLHSCHSWAEGHS